MTHKQNHKNKSKKEKNTSNSVVLIKHSIANKTKREIQTCAQITMKLYLMICYTNSIDYYVHYYKSQLNYVQYPKILDEWL